MVTCKSWRARSLKVATPHGGEQLGISRWSGFVWVNGALILLPRIRRSPRALDRRGTTRTPNNTLALAFLQRLLLGALLARSNAGWLLLIAGLRLRPGRGGPRVWVERGPDGGRVVVLHQDALLGKGRCGRCAGSGRGRSGGCWRCACRCCWSQFPFGRFAVGRHAVGERYLIICML